MKRTTLFLATATMVSISWGASAADSKKKELTFGVCLPQLDNEGFRVNLDSIQVVTNHAGIKTLPFSANNSAETQMLQIEDLLVKGVDAIIFTPVDADAMSTAVEKANKAKIPIVAMDRSTTGGKLTGLVESDNVAHGRGAADLMASAAKKAGLPLSKLKVLELLGAQATSAGLERHKGFADRAKELGIPIVSALPTEWQSDKANSATMDAFQANPDINAIFEASDVAMHAGVESALKQIGKLHAASDKSHIIITTVDGGPKGIEAVKNGYIDGIAAQQLIMMGKKAAEMAIAAQQGKVITESIIRFRPDMVTPENVTSKDHWANQL